MKYSDIIQYFTNLQIASKELRATYVGDYDRIYDVINNPDEIDLPALWIESPDVTFKGSEDSMTDQWSLALVFLYKGSPQNKETNQYQLEQSFRMARRFVGRVMKDSNDGLLRAIVVNNGMSPIDPFSSDWLVGWRLELILETYSDLPCYYPEMWDEAIEAQNKFRFFAERDEDDIRIYDIELLNESIWNYTKSVQIDNGAPQPLLSNLIENVVGKNVYITYTANNGDAFRFATLFIAADDTLPRESVPYHYNHYSQS